MLYNVLYYKLQRSHKLTFNLQNVPVLQDKPITQIQDVNVLVISKVLSSIYDIYVLLEKSFQFSSSKIESMFL